MKSCILENVIQSPIKILNRKLSSQQTFCSILGRGLVVTTDIFVVTTDLCVQSMQSLVATAEPIMSKQ